MVTVVGTDEFEGWFDGLSDGEAEAVSRYTGLLEQDGITLGHPYSSAIKGSNLALRELRVKHSSSVIRVFYLFDPNRTAVLLIGGDKGNDKRFYGRMIKIAETVYAKYLKSIGR